jgi:uncharacterized protein (DUF2147 family)
LKEDGVKRNFLCGVVVSAVVMALFLFLAVPCFAASPDAIVGVWYNQAKDAKIDIAKCGDTFCGKIVWLKEPNYLPNSKEGTPGTPKVDHKNPNPELRKRPVMGLEIVRGFKYSGDDLWKDGTVYDPKSGKTYSAKMTMVSATQLNLRGFVGISLFGRTEKWTKAD